MAFSLVKGCILIIFKYHILCILTVLRLHYDYLKCCILKEGGFSLPMRDLSIFVLGCENALEMTKCGWSNDWKWLLVLIKGHKKVILVPFVFCF